jgi:3-hydroxyisobutyrate dehydrogenase-like beta-hydroxyacid dehydrogenase
MPASVAGMERQAERGHVTIMSSGRQKGKTRIEKPRNRMPNLDLTYKTAEALESTQRKH